MDVWLNVLIFFRAGHHNVSAGHDHHRLSVAPSVFPKKSPFRASHMPVTRYTEKTAVRVQTESIERLLPEVQDISINAVQLVKENNRRKILFFIENNSDLQEFRHRENNDGEKIACRSLNTYIPTEITYFVSLFETM